MKGKGLFGPRARSPLLKLFQRERVRCRMDVIRVVVMTYACRMK